jgi:hypothetical protein
MKIIKTLFWLIILALLGTLVYQNQSYFLASPLLNFDLKVPGWSWTLPPLQNIAYFGICFVLGLILAGIKGLVTVFGLKRQIKKGNATITGLQKEIESLKTELDVFKHDPYIKKEIENKAALVGNLPEDAPNRDSDA